MVATNWPGLVGGVSPDPWVERDKLTSGDPDAITGLATTFESAAQEAESATRTGGQASLATGEAYRVDGDEVHAVDVHTGQTRDLLGAGGQDLERIGQILRGIGSDLSAKSGTATQKVTTLEGELQTLQNTFNQTEQTYRTQRANALTALDAMTLDVQFQAARATFQASSVDLAETAGRSVADLVTQYDDALGGRSRELSELGYTVPAGIDQGPGDVESDPNAGAQDAQTVVDAMQQDPGQQSMAEIDAASGQMRAINDKVERGEPLTTAERDYLNQFYETLGTDNLARLPEYLQDAAAVTTPPGAPSIVAEGAADSAMQPFGDSIMNLSQGARYESLPAPVRDLLDTRVGHVDPHTGIRYPNERFLNTSGYPEGSNPTAYTVGGGVTGLDRYRSITDLLSSSDRAPGDGLANELVDSAIRTRQDLNAAQEGGRWVLNSVARGNDDAVGALDIQVDDAAASDALSLAARNVDASSTALLDERQRSAVLGLNWEDATGASDLVGAGTLRDPNAGGGGQKQAEAALAVVQEVGGDRDGYLSRMADPVKDAVDSVGVSYMDAFAASPTDSSGPIDNREDAMGRNVGETFQLTAEDRDHYLQFVSGTGDDRAAAFQSHAKSYSQYELADALRHGDQENVQIAMERAGRLDGAISQANFDFTADGASDRDDQAAAAARAAQIDARASQGALNTAAVFGRELAVAVIPGGTVIGPALSILTELGKGGIGMATLPDAAPSAELPQTLEDLRRADSQDAVLNRDMLIAGAMDTAGLFGNDPPDILGAASPTSDSQPQDELGSQVRSGLDRWATQNGAPGTSDAPDPDTYTSARSSSFSGAFDGGDDPTDSNWAGDGSGHMYYGESDQGVRTADPRRLDDPEFVPQFPR